MKKAASRLRLGGGNCYSLQSSFIVRQHREFATHAEQGFLTSSVVLPLRVSSARHSIWREQRRNLAYHQQDAQGEATASSDPADVNKFEQELREKGYVSPYHLGRMVAKYTRNDIPLSPTDDLFRFLKKIKSEDLYEYAVLINALAEADLESLAQSVYHTAQSHRKSNKLLQPDVRYYTAVLNVMRQQGKEKAMEIYEDMQKAKVRNPVNGDWDVMNPTVETYNALIRACGGQTAEDVQDALRFFKKIKESSLEPDVTTFENLISVLGNVHLEKAMTQEESQPSSSKKQPGSKTEGKGGDVQGREDYSKRVDRAVALMGSMFKEYGVRPRASVYNAVFTCYENILVEELLVQARMKKPKGKYVPRLFVNDYLLEEREEVLGEMFDILDHIIKNKRPVLALPDAKSYRILLRCAVKLEHKDRALFVVGKMIDRGFDVEAPHIADLRKRLERL